ncbi:MAG: hypothetical protein KC776_24105, partial [Myxococcales bacterium]|nr:hypothetical protein [Myxococcales bacterium]
STDMLPELLQKAPPRSGVESLLSATKARVYQTARIVVALCFGPFALLVLIVAAQGAWGAFPMAGLGILAVSVLIGGPLLWYVTQDLRWARKLLTDGAVVEGTVVETGAHPSGQQTVTVEYVVGTQPRRLRFRVPISKAELVVVSERGVPVVHAPADPDAAGIVLDGVGLVTTR